MSGRRPSDDELAERFHEAGRKVKLGGLYRHRKTGRTYVLSGLSLDEATLEPVVIYWPRPHAGPAWTRPLASFLERFTPIGEDG